MNDTNSYSRTDVEFKSHGTTCRAWHYIPDSPASEPVPCIVMAHGLAGTRDAGLEPYAEQFANAGYQVLVFDYRHFGASDGKPRQLLSVHRQLQDWQAAIDYARKLESVDPDRIALWGSSFSGGHVVVAAAKDGKVAAISAQGPMMDGMAAVMGMLDYAGIGQVARLSLLGIADQLRGWLRLPPVKVPVIARPGGFAAMSSHDAYRGYKAIVPEDWENEMTARMALTLAMYRPINYADKIPCPALIQVCLQDSVAPAEAAIKTAQKMGDRAELKEYDIGHFDIYVKDDFKRAVADQLLFYNRVLLGK